MTYDKVITFESGKCGGKPCIRGMRITVYDVLEYLASGMSEGEILRDFPDLTREDIRDVFDHGFGLRWKDQAKRFHRLAMRCGGDAGENQRDDTEDSHDILLRLIVAGWPPDGLRRICYNPGNLRA